MCSGEVNYAALGIASNSPKQSNQLGIYIEPNSVDCVVNHNSNPVPGTLNNKILTLSPKSRLLDTHVASYGQRH